MEEWKEKLGKYGKYVLGVAFAVAVVMLLVGAARERLTNQPVGNSAPVVVVKEVPVTVMKEVEKPVLQTVVVEKEVAVGKPIVVMPTIAPPTVTPEPTPTTTPEGPVPTPLFETEIPKPHIKVGLNDGRTMICLNTYLKAGVRWYECEVEGKEGVQKISEHWLLENRSWWHAWD